MLDFNSMGGSVTVRNLGSVDLAIHSAGSCIATKNKIIVPPKPLEIRSHSTSPPYHIRHGK